MNELLALLTFLIFAGGILVALRIGKIALYVVSIFIILATNATIGISVEIFGWPISLAIIPFSLIFLITDILSEFFHRHEAYKLALTNLGVQVFFWIYILIASLSVIEGSAAYNSMIALYATTPRITIAALLAAIGAFVDVFIYEGIKNHFKKKDGVISQLWVRNNLSTIIAQMINTPIFFYIALWGLLPFNILNQIVLAAIGAKVIVALLDTPFLYIARIIVKDKNIVMSKNL